MGYFSDLHIRALEQVHIDLLHWEPQAACPICGSPQAVIDVCGQTLQVSCTDPKCEGARGGHWEPVGQLSIPRLLPRKPATIPHQSTSSSYKTIIVLGSPATLRYRTELRSDRFDWNPIAKHWSRPYDSNLYYKWKKIMRRESDAGEWPVRASSI